MTTPYLRKKYGFALVDIVIYIALFSVLIGGVSISAYSLFKSTNQNHTRIMILEEGNFLLAKISWIVSQSKMITIPAISATSTMLSIVPSDTSLGPSVDIKKLGTGIILRRKNISYILSNSNVMVSQVVFTRKSLNEENTLGSVQSEFTLSARAPDGSVVTSDFSTIDYIHQ